MRRPLAALLGLQMILAAPAALACACCGEPDTWELRHAAPGEHPWKVVDQLALESGWITLRPNDGAEHMFEVARVTRNGENFEFRSADDQLIGVFIPVGSMEVRLADLAFQMPDPPEDGGLSMVPIYQELRLQGRMTGPATDAGAPGPELEADLVLRGSAGVCIESGHLKRWLLRAGDEALRISGAGDISERPEPRRPP